MEFEEEGLWEGLAARVVVGDAKGFACVVVLPLENGLAEAKEDVDGFAPKREAPMLWLDCGCSCGVFVGSATGC